MEKTPQHAKAVCLLVLTAVLWSTGGLLIKLVAWHPAAIAGARSAIAALFMLALIRRPRLNWSRPQIGGAVCYALTVILFVSATKMTTAANAVLLQYTAPVYVALLAAWFLGERLALRDWLVLGLVMGGMALFFLDRLSPAGFLGNLTAILSGVAMAGMVIFLRKQKDGSPVESVLLGNVLTALAGLPFALGRPGPDAAGWLGLLVLGVFQLGLSYVLYSQAIKHVTALEGILIPAIEPLLNPVWVFAATGERPGRWALAGGAIVLATMIGRYLRPGQSGKARAAGREAS